MSQDSLSDEQVARQVRQHLESMRAAGIDWAPSATPLAIQQREVSAMPANREDATPAKLFEEKQGDQSLAKRCAALELVKGRVAKCTRCTELAATRTQTVFGVGRMDADLCFIGEAPGADEDARGEPFVGAAGQLLNRIITACGMQREEVYICNILRCRPPGNRLPLANEAANCREYLEETLALVQPKFICALGACAAQNLLGSTLAIGKLRGRFHDYKGIPVLCTYHPAYLLRSPDKKKDVWEDMKVLLAKMGRPIPAKG